MQWQNPAGAWAFLLLLPVLALYFLRKQAKRQQVSSLLLWRLTEKQTEQNRPFQRLKSRLLLWLQLLAVVLLTLSLMGPMTMGQTRGETVMIFDLSASMQTTRNGSSRMEEAKAAALDLLGQMGAAEPVTVLAAGSTMEQLIARSTDHEAVRSQISGLQAQNGGAELDGAVSLAQAMARELPGLSIAVFSDTYVPTADNVSVYAVGQETANRTIRSLSLSQQENGALAFAQLTNLGSAQEARLECYADGLLCDVRTVTLPENGQATARFSIPDGAQNVRVCFAESDGLTVDDRRWAVQPVQQEYRVLLVSEGNVFMEKALTLRDNVTVVRAAPEDGLEAQGFDLYVYDGALPESLPESGAILALNPDKPVLGITPLAEQPGTGALRVGSGIRAQSLCVHLLLEQIALKTYRPLSGGESILTMGDNTLLALSTENGRTAAVLGFDLHQSNFPLKADFPVLIQNLLTVLLPADAASVQNAVCGQPLTIPLNDRTLKASVTLPSGGTETVENGVLTDPAEPGLYTLTEELADGSQRQTSFALHIPFEESDTVSLAPSVQAAGTQNAPTQTGRNASLWLMLLCLLVLMAEWEVSRRGA